jgi:glycine/D-amino acid oxidase-like deaminating enzyme
VTKDSTVYENVRVLDPPVRHQSIENGWKNLTSTFPAFASAAIVQSWSGYIDAIPDLLSVISQCEILPGQYILSGYSGHGFGIGLGAGHLTADLVSGAERRANKP